MSQNYFKHLLPSDFVCLYVGNWRDSLLEEAIDHEDIEVVDEEHALIQLKSPNSKKVICVKSDFESAKYRKQKNIDTLYKAAKVSGKRVVILGYRGLGIVKEQVA
ncbi:hypothetical protein OTK49_01435 [Vibrio coralliirubri]|uniref:hypothetical protein n=1 Tax=Vibrio coralliirubri TaxID=1516159 RepID=UPI0022846E23|nr:hypothetical protein [Vibrio coralliirubri]MCY9861187.1 hypothetical protein [Vibrio coralliirubri]